MSLALNNWAQILPKMIILKLPILVSYESIFGAEQILIVLQGVHGMGLFCLDRQTLAGSVDLDRALWDKAFDLGPPCSLLVWDVTYMQVVIYTMYLFYNRTFADPGCAAWCAQRDLGLLSLDRWAFS